MPVPPTSRTAVRNLLSDDPGLRAGAWETVIAAYWQPCRHYARWRWRLPDDDARDLTQSFFGSAFESAKFAAYAPERGRFRAFLRTCFDNFARNEFETASRLKRGGGVTFVALHPDQASEAGYDEVFDREWIRSVFERAVHELRNEPPSAAFEIFERYDLAEADRPSYADLARDFAVPVTQVTNHLAAMRRRLRAAVIEVLRESAISEADFRASLRAVLGGDA